MSDERSPWIEEPEPVSESEWTPGGEGWTTWNGMSAEREFCEFAAALARLVRPDLVIETGVGQGFTTRRILDVVPDRYVGYESEPEFRDLLRGLDVWTERSRLAEEPGPDEKAMSACGLAVLDSTSTMRIRELQLWRDHAPVGSYVLMHDVRADHPVEEGPHRRLAREVGDAGILLANPRGSWLDRKR